MIMIDSCISHVDTKTLNALHNKGDVKNRRLNGCTLDLAQRNIANTCPPIDLTSRSATELTAAVLRREPHFLRCSILGNDS